MDVKGEEPYNAFKILKDHFREQLKRYLGTINAPMTLIMEESLITVITALLMPIPENIKVFGSCKLIGDKVRIYHFLKPNFLIKRSFC